MFWLEHIAFKMLSVSACCLLLTYCILFSPAWYDDWLGVCVGAIIGWIVPDIYYYVKYTVMK